MYVYSYNAYQYITVAVVVYNVCDHALLLYNYSFSKVAIMCDVALFTINEINHSIHGVSHGVY